MIRHSSVAAILLGIVVSSTSGCAGTIRKKITLQTQNLVVARAETKPLVVMPKIADLKVRQDRVSGAVKEESTTFLNLTSLKQVARAKLLQREQADVLVDPLYVVTKNERDVTVEVRAYPADYKNFRDAKLEDFKGEEVPASALTVAPPKDYTFQTVERVQLERNGLVIFRPNLQSGDTFTSSFSGIHGTEDWTGRLSGSLPLELSYHSQLGNLDWFVDLGFTSMRSEDDSAFPTYGQRYDLVGGRQYRGDLGKGEFAVGVGAGIVMRRLVSFDGPVERYNDKSDIRSELGYLYRFSAGYIHPINDTFSVHSDIRRAWFSDEDEAVNSIGFGVGCSL